MPRIRSTEVKRLDRKRVLQEKNVSLLQSVSTAGHGLIQIAAEERGVQRIIFTAVCVCAAAVFFSIPVWQVLFICFCWIQALTYEIFNTALEDFMDYASEKEYHPLIRKGKDFAAASVFLASTFALCVSAFMLLGALL
jgi:undecaprenol kinase